MWLDWLLVIILGLAMCGAAVRVGMLGYQLWRGPAEPEPDLLPQVDRDTAARQEWEAAFPGWWDYVPLPLVIEGRPESPLAQAARITRSQARLDRYTGPKAGDPYDLVNDLARMGLPAAAGPILGEAIVSAEQVEALFYPSRPRKLTPWAHELDFCTCPPCNKLRREYYAIKRLDSGWV